MHIQQIRNATLRITYSEKLFITDPYLAAKYTMPSYIGDLPSAELNRSLTSEDHAHAGRTQWQ